tara:strand:+ start:271 stop:513 length:243 start_codon:yes stop_codon:yes gene_type:complete
MANSKEIKAELQTIYKKLGLNSDGLRPQASKKTLFIRNITGQNKKGFSGSMSEEEQKLRERMRRLEQMLFDMPDKEKRFP